MVTFADCVKPFLIDLILHASDNKPEPTIRTAMPLCLGHLRSKLPLPNTSTTERVMLQISEGLRFMHSNLVLHRDLKPDNILIVSVSPMTIKIADYGWATSLNDTITLYGMCGTTAFCAPEALTLNGIHTPAIDVYSLGAVFFWMLEPNKVQRGWVVRSLRGRKQSFNTAFENAANNPPQRFSGLVQSMLAPNPKSRCSLDRCIEVVKAQKHDWTKQTDIMPVATATPLATGQRGVERTSNATRLQQTPFGRNPGKANKPKLTLFAQAQRPENGPSPWEAPVNHGYKNWRPMLQSQEPRALATQNVPKQKSLKPAHVQGLVFNAGLPSYEEATRQNPFAVKPYKGNKNKKSSHPKPKTNGQRTREAPVLRAPLPAAQRAPKDRSQRHGASSVARAAPLATIGERQPQNSRPLVRRSHQHVVNIHRAQHVGIRRRREQLEDRQAARDKRLAKLRDGVCHVAKGYWLISSALCGFACEGLLMGGERIYRMFIDSENAREALEFAGRHVDAEAQLVASLQRHSLRAAPGNGRSASGRQRSARPYTDEEMLNNQFMVSRRN